MRYGSVCSGIEAATVAWHSLGWKAAWFAEIEKFPSQVLAHHYHDVPNLGDMTTIAEKVKNKELEAPDILVGGTPCQAFSVAGLRNSLVLAHHYHDVPNLGDMTTIAEKVKNKELEAPDILVGGTPCQAFSVAGLRNSLDDDRGQLSLEFVRIANEIDSARLVRGYEPVIAVWENVPGVLNTKDNAFGCFLGALSGEECELQPPGGRWKNAGCVFGPSRQVVWRVLDAQHFGLAQRRKRVFVIASARTECIAEILFERKGVFGDIKKSQNKGESAARNSGIHTNRTSETVSGKSIVPPLLASHGQKKWLGNQEAFCGDYYIKHAIGISPRSLGLPCTNEQSGTLTATDYKQPQLVVECVGVGGCNSNAAITPETSATLLSNNDRGYIIHGTQDPIFNNKTAHCLGRNNGQENVLCEPAYAMIADATPKISKQINGTLRSSGGGGIVPSSVVYQYIARYLTEVEAERLQGFPDNYTNIPGASKGNRYKALGNSMAVPVMQWIGKRINEFFADIESVGGGV